jgi:Zn finger protein HypA/HybF involved in hydrogenase expression
VTKKINSIPISGDEADIECSRCGSTETTYEEYTSSREPDVSELGIYCPQCDHHEDSDKLSLRIESRVMEQYENN